MEKYDIAIIGSGPAGQSAAINIKLRKKTMAIFGQKNLSEKMNRAEMVNNYLGDPNLTGKEHLKKFADHLDLFGIEVEDQFIDKVKKEDGFFHLFNDENIEVCRSEALIIATGVFQKNPIKGEVRYLGNGVSHCCTCDAMLYRGDKVVVIGMNEEAVAEANLLSKYASKTIFVTNGKRPEGLDDKVDIYIGKALELVGDKRAKKLILDKGEIEAKGFFISKDASSHVKLLEGLEIDKTSIIVDRNQATNIEGVFAAGDISGRPYQVAKAVGEGQKAGLNAVSYIDNLRKEERRRLREKAK